VAVYVVTAPKTVGEDGDYQRLDVAERVAGVLGYAGHLTVQGATGFGHLVAAIEYGMPPWRQTKMQGGEGRIRQRCGREPL
jgi:hypothetical protein